MRLATGILATAIFMVSNGSSALARDEGLASIHDLRRERGKLCMSDHFHSGSGTAATKSAAKRRAIAAWADFTDLEYGRAWARWSNAGSQATRYTKAEDGWTANIEARPCRR